jgi:hypothetical protein
VTLSCVSYRSPHCKSAFPTLGNKEGRKVELIKGERHRITMCTEFGDDTCEEHKMKINKVDRSRLARPQR